MYPYRIAHNNSEIYLVFNLVIPHGNLSAHYDIHIKYLGITYDETKAVDIFRTTVHYMCQQANGQFCSINVPLQPLANPPSGIAVIYAKNTAGIEKRCSLQIRNMKQYHHPNTNSSKCMDTNFSSLQWIITRYNVNLSR